MNRISKEEFDRLAWEKQFSEGPFIDAFGDHWAEPYHPYRELWGTLKDGTQVESSTDPEWSPNP